MNIQQAKEQIKNALIAYRTRDSYGRLRIPTERQRPIFLSGAPGIGKTAIVQQVAQEMHVGFVSYSITHHTRQSALGLPYITEQEFDGRRYRMSEYTMSEIIAAVYKQMQQTGLREGILFLDEINCVSETLEPAMLQFLQYKVFGQHRVPDGWIVVTAGNPPEYNRAVREFDMVTMDRLKKVDIEPDYETWRSWAETEHIHPAVRGYLEVRREDFYQVKNTVEGLSFVTPRGWVDLSAMLQLYEENHIRADEYLIRQYLQNDRIIRQFTVFYELWKKYESEYRIEDILNGKETEELIERAKKAPYDEKISLIGLLLDGIGNHMQEVLDHREMMAELKAALAKITGGENSLSEENPLSAENSLSEEKPSDRLEKKLQEIENQIRTASASYTARGLKRLEQVRIWLMDHTVKGHWQEEKVRDAYAAERRSLSDEAQAAGEMLENLFDFAKRAFTEEGMEMTLIVTSLTTNPVTARFIGRYGSESYYKYNRELMLDERKLEVMREVDEVMA